MELSSMRGVWIVAWGRALLALWLVMAVCTGRLPADTDRRTVLVLLGIYVGYSLAVLVAMRARRLLFGLAPPNIGLMAFDVLYFVVLLYVSGGADSPLFGPLFFLILAGAVQWGARGAAAVGATVLLAYLPSGSEALLSGFNSPDALTFLVRLGYMGTSTMTLVVFANHVERVIAEMARLSTPVFADFDGSEPPLNECLRHAMEVFGARTGLILGVDAEEPYVQLLVSSATGVHSRRLKPTHRPWVQPLVADRVFLWDRDRRQTLTARDGRVRFGPRTPITDDLVEGLSFRRALVIPAQAEGIQTWTLLADYPDKSAEDIAAGAMTGVQISMMLERWRAQTLRHDAAVTEERIRLSRDLHDGVLQFLAGAGLQLEALARSKDLPPDARARLVTVVQALGDEQVELRRFVTGSQRRSDAPIRDLSVDLADLATRLTRHWRIQVTTIVSEPAPKVSDALSYDIGRLVREAVANAVRHGYASSVEIRVTHEHGHLTLAVIDNGSGFDSAGLGIDADIPAPRSLSERVRTLNGAMQICSKPTGAEIVIRLPFPEMNRCPA